MATQLILGPPGTGKTTTLLNIVDDALQSGIKPEEIAFVSFTKKAAREAKERAIARFPTLDPKRFKYFATLHSIAFRMTGMTSDRVLQGSHLRIVGRLCGLEITGKVSGEEEGGLAVGNTKGDKYLFEIGMARAWMKPVESYIHSLPTDETDYINLRELRALANQLEHYKRTEGILDFPDMLDEAEQIGSLPVKLAIIDEAQDLTRRQWQFSRALFTGVPNVYVAGDDDQAIYRWSGADIDTFLTLKGTKRVLDKSYRLPKSIWQYSNCISSRIQKRYAKNWEPDDREGSVNMIRHVTDAPVGDGGEWLILLRNHFLMEDVVKTCRVSGIPYMRGEYPSIKAAHRTAIDTWNRLKDDQIVSGSEAMGVYDLLLASKGYTRGAKAQLAKALDDGLTYGELVRDFGLLVPQRLDWDHAFTRHKFAHVDGLAADGNLYGKMDREDVTYYRKVAARRESLTDVPRVRISTIHAVKGGEADNVLLIPRMARRTLRGYERNPDDEHRVWYVGASRARENLYVVQGDHRAGDYDLPQKRCLQA